MKRIINGKVYDTETTNELGTYQNTPNISDCRWYAETLYLKKTGEFFLYGEGNAESKYAKDITNTERASGQAIVPLAFEDAERWAEIHLDSDEYIRIFGEPEESEAVEQLHLYINRKTVAKLKKEASRAGKSLSSFVEDMLNAELYR